MEKIRDWLRESDLDEIIAVIAGIVTIFVAAIAAGQRLWPSVRGSIAKVQHFLAAARRRLGIGREVACLRLRLIVIFGGSAALIEGACRALESQRTSEQTRTSSDIAIALAFLGKTDAATSRHLSRAATGVAWRRGPKEALAIVEPKKDIDFGAREVWRTLVDLCSKLDSSEREFDWRYNKATKVPIAAIADEVKESGGLKRWPACLDDVEAYLHSEPDLSPVRDISKLRPIDEKRLRVLRWSAARAAPCTSLPRIAANLAVLVSAIVIFRCRRSTQR